MLTITIPETELFNEETEEFIYSKEQTLHLEHSLLSISKWESKWNKAFLGKQEKTPEEMLDYIRCMTLNQGVSSDTYYGLTQKNIEDIKNYIDSPMTATTISKTDQRPSREIVTSELIYYWMITYNIPFECQKWHINRLLTLIQVCNVKNTPPGQKMSKSAIMRRNSELNAARRKQLNSKG